jgi:hypothetical protein
MSEAQILRKKLWWYAITLRRNLWNHPSDEEVGDHSHGPQQKWELWLSALFLHIYKCFHISHIIHFLHVACHIRYVLPHPSPMITCQRIPPPSVLFTLNPKQTSPMVPQCSSLKLWCKSVPLVGEERRRMSLLSLKAYQCHGDLRHYPNSHEAGGTKASDPTV